MQKKISESSSYNLLTIYLTFVSSILNTFVIARLLAPEEWALIILTLSFINIAIFFCNLFPPNAQDSIKYYLPHLSSMGPDRESEKRSFILHIYKIRLLSALSILMIYLVIISLTNFEVRLYEVILIMSPIILSNIVRYLNSSILMAYQRFKLVFFSNILNPLVVTTCNFLIFFYDLDTPIILIAYAYLLGGIISCIVSVIVIIPFIPFKIDKKDIVDKSKFFAIHKEYGSYLIIANIFSLISGLIINIFFLTFGVVAYITYIAICQISVTSALLFSSSNPESYISIFSEINYEKNAKYFENLFYKLSIFLMLFNCIIIAIMLFYIELYIVVIYSPKYLIILWAIQLFLFTGFAKMIINNLTILTRATNHTKIEAKFAFIEMLTSISFTLIALLFFDFYTLIVFHIINSYLLTFFLFYLIKKNTNLNLKLIESFKPFLIFMTCFIITFPLFNIIHFQISNKAYYNFLLNGTIKFIIFLFLFYIIIFITKLIKRKEFNQLIEIVPILSSKKSYIKYFVDKIEKLLPK